MSAEYSVEEVRQAQEVIARCYEVNGEPPRWAVERISTTLAERIKADESSLPVGVCVSNGYGGKIAYLDDQLPLNTLLFTHPPAQAAQVDALVTRNPAPNAAAPSVPSSPTVTLHVGTPTAEPVAQGEAVAWRYVNKAGKPISQWALVPTDDASFVEFVKHRAKLAGSTVEFATPPAQPRAVPDVRAMADRLMGWRLPDDFRPDCGISFDPESLKHWPGIWPVGTNLFTADQAEQMFRYVLDAAPSPTTKD